MVDLGLPWPNFNLKWTIVCFNCYLIFSLNFVGLFAQGIPHRLNQGGQNQQQSFRASPFDKSSYQQGYQSEDSIDLSKIPSPSVPHKLIENSIDRFDAYGDYEYIDIDRHPSPIQFHKPLPHRPQTLHQHHEHLPVAQPIRRLDYQQQHPNHRYPANPFRDEPNPIYSYGYQPQRPVSPPNTFNPLQALKPPKFDLFGFLSVDKNDQVYPPGYPVPQQESGGILDPLLNLVGLKETPQPIDEYPSHYHDPYEYDYGDYIEGYQNHVKPIHAYTISERVAKWFTGFKIPSAKHKYPKRKDFERLEGPLDYSQYDTDDDQNLIFYNNQNQQQQGVSKPVGLHDFGDVLNAIRRNETTGEVFKKILSATAALSERADSHPVFMMWTIPTTILALLGSVYFVGALAILSYKYMLDGTSNPANLISVVIVFTIPLLLGFLVVGSRSAINGELQMSRIMRGDIKGSMRQDFDGVDFTMDAIFGSSALLGIGWLVSITV